jgi:hypothetical protein
MIEPLEMAAMGEIKLLNAAEAPVKKDLVDLERRLRVSPSAFLC